MQERHKFENFELLVQLIPETGENNFQYLIFDWSRKEAISIDCYDSQKVINALDGSDLIACLATHHHWDHTGGIPELKEAFPNSQIISGDKRVKGTTDLITQDESIKIGSFDITVYQTPCHTRGSVCYHFPKLNALFTGDTIFFGGVGRFFEGTATQMVEAVNKIKKLDTGTHIYPGHEYTVSNLKFATYYEPENTDIKQWQEKTNEQRKNESFTIPTTIAIQNQVNPFFRFAEVSIQKKTGSDNDDESMRIIREAKNCFKG